MTTGSMERRVADLAFSLRHVPLETVRVLLVSDAPSTMGSPAWPSTNVPCPIGQLGFHGNPSMWVDLDQILTQASLSPKV